MQTKRLLFKTCDPSDERRYFLALEDKTLLLLHKIEPGLLEMRNYLGFIIQKQTHSIMQSLDKFETVYDEKGIVNHLLNVLTKKAREQHVEIINWQSNLKDDFYRLNFAWIKKYFNAQLNTLGRQTLERPESYYLARGSYICFAVLETKVVGCIAIANHGDGDGDGLFEISKIAVQEQHQSFAIGRKMLLTALDKTRQLKANNVYLKTSSLLPRELPLYQKMGFKEAVHPDGVSAYWRFDMYMALYI